MTAFRLPSRSGACRIFTENSAKIRLSRRTFSKPAGTHMVRTRIRQEMTLFKLLIAASAAMLSSQSGAALIHEELPTRISDSGLIENTAESLFESSAIIRYMRDAAEHETGLAIRSGRTIDLVVVQKSSHKMELIKNGKVFKKYWIALGHSPRGRKLMRGDQKTPEGKYILDFKNSDSNFYKSVHISYPNQDDLRRAKAAGVDPGSMIMIHGQPNSIGRTAGNDSIEKFVQPMNWTNGCIALINSDMDEFYNMVEPGTPIIIKP